MKVKSKALEINLAETHVDVSVDEKYAALQDVMSKYYGLTEGVNTFLRELSHPLKNWRFIVSEARKYSLEYYHLMKNHPNGPQAGGLLVDIYLQTMLSSAGSDEKTDATDNLLLLIQKIIKDSGSSLEKFMPVVENAFQRLTELPDELFELIVRSYYPINRLAQLFLDESTQTTHNFEALNALLMKYFQYTFDFWLTEGDPQTWFTEEAIEIDADNNFKDFFKNISHSKLQIWKNTNQSSPAAQRPGIRRGFETPSGIARIQSNCGCLPPNTSRSA